MRREAAEDDESAINLLSDSVLQSQSHSGSVVPFCGEAMMPLTMRPSGLSSGIDKTGRTTPCTGGWDVGRIYETRGGPDSLRWFWSMTVIGPMTRSDRVATLEEAKAQLRKSWDAWKVWAKLEEVD